MDDSRPLFEDQPPDSEEMLERRRRARHPDSIYPGNALMQAAMLQQPQPDITTAATAGSGSMQPGSSVLPGPSAPG